jgi:hypothetical protein
MPRPGAQRGNKNATGANQYSLQEHMIRAFPPPIIVCAFPKPCGCAWGWAPSLSGVAGMPFVLKFPYRNCTEGHNREYRN